ncbi:MAG: ABC transporter permease [Pirellulales bacterium]
MLTWILAKKDLRLLLRDPRAVVVLLAMPLIFILVLGVSLGEGFGQKPDDRLRVSIVDLDAGYADPDADSQAPKLHWSRTVERDLAQTAGIRVEKIPSLAEAEQLVKDGKRAAVLVFGPKFSQQVTLSSFLIGGVNPLYRDGINLEELDAKLLRDPTQLTAASIIEQVGQVTMLRVVLPWMIGRAFDKIGDRMGSIVANVLQQMFPNYDLTGTTWAALTRAPERSNDGAEVAVYQPPAQGWLSRGALRYQILVPSYIVMFAYFLVLTVGWLFVAERRQGTLKRLRAAPLSRAQILFGKLLPCFLLSLGQGFFLLLAGKIVFGMSFGTEPWWLVPVVICTSFSAMGLALLVAALARTEAQVAIYGTLLVLVLAGLSGCLMGDRELMPENMQRLSLVTPHAWALIAYKQLLANPGEPNQHLILQSCGALIAFGAAFIGLAWTMLRLDDEM